MVVLVVQFYPVQFWSERVQHPLYLERTTLRTTERHSSMITTWKDHLFCNAYTAIYILQVQSFVHNIASRHFNKVVVTKPTIFDRVKGPVLRLVLSYKRDDKRIHAFYLYFLSCGGCDTIPVRCARQWCLVVRNLQRSSELFSQTNHRFYHRVGCK